MASLLSFGQSGLSATSATRAFSVQSKSATREFTVPYGGIADGLMTEDEVLADPLCPQIGDTYDLNPMCRLSSVRVHNNPDNPLRWEAEVTYSSEMPNASEIQQDDNPLNRPVEISSDFALVQLPLRKDINGDVVKLSNGLVPSPELQYSESIKIYTFVKNYPKLNPAWESLYHNKINSDDYLGYAARHVWCHISGRSMSEKGHNYAQYTIKFQCNPAMSWNPSLIHQSYMRLVSGELRNIRDEHGQFVSHPWPLADDGDWIPPANILTVEPYVSSVEAYHEVDFNNMGLPKI